VNHSRDFETECETVTDDKDFFNSKETDHNNKYITHIGSHFSLGLTAQPKLFVISRILAELLVYAIIRLIRISAELFTNIHIFSDWRFGVSS